MGTGGESQLVLRTSVANFISQGALPATARRSDRQQLSRLAPAARASGLAPAQTSEPGRLLLAGVKLVETCLDFLRAKPETCLRPRAHALATEIARVPVHPPTAQAVLPGYLGGRKKRGLETVQRL